jgi:hypothetical protein
MERALSTVEEITREVPRITRTIYRKKTRNPVDLACPPLASPQAELRARTPAGARSGGLFSTEKD